MTKDEKAELELLEWIGRATPLLGPMGGYLYPHRGARWYPWPTIYDGAPSGVGSPKRPVEWGTIQRCVKKGLLGRNQTGGPKRLPPDDRVHWVTDDGWAAIGKPPHRARAAEPQVRDRDRGARRRPQPTVATPGPQTTLFD